MKKLWLIWARTLDHRVGRTDDDQPDIPILSLKDAQFSFNLANNYSRFKYSDLFIYYCKCY